MTSSTRRGLGSGWGWEIEQFADELAELFAHTVDLVSLHALHPLPQPSVLAEARPVYAAWTPSCPPRMIDAAPS